MKKIIALTLIAIFTSGCSSKGTQQEIFIDAALACSQVCNDHPSISQVSSSAGGGLPLFFIGKTETSCSCRG